MREQLHGGLDQASRKENLTPSGTRNAPLGFNHKVKTRPSECPPGFTCWILLTDHT